MGLVAVIAVIVALNLALENALAPIVIMKIIVFVLGDVLVNVMIAEYSIVCLIIYQTVIVHVVLLLLLHLNVT
jgi:hypothetical protein